MIVVADLVDRLLAGDVRALARAISLVEDGASQTADILRRVYPRTGGAWVVGVTGPPGAGKSSLVDGLAAAWRAAGERVGIVAVDPSSAFSGGPFWATGSAWAGTGRTPTSSFARWRIAAIPAACPRPPTTPSI